MDDTWVGIDVSSISSHSSCYSDELDNDAEAELYSLIHHREHLADVNYSSGKSALESSKILNVKDMRETSVTLQENFRTNASESFILATQNNANSDTDKLLKRDYLKQGKNPSCSILLNSESNSEHNSLSDILCLYDSKAKDLPEQESSANSKNVRNLSENLYYYQENEIIVIDSSDNDSSILWTEPECSDRKKESNGFNVIDTVSIDLDSSNNSLIISSPLRENNSLISSLSVKDDEQSQSNTKADKHCKGLWYVNKEDIYRRKKWVKRYYGKKWLKRYYGKKSVQCYKCYRKGHATEMCPVPHVVKCFICGGSHVGTRCNRRICNKCFKSGHDGSNCCKIYPGVCCLCRMKGHSEIDCPDIWRRYHLTTEPSDIVEGMLNMKQNRTFYCFNCGVPGHFGALCNHSRIKDSLQTWPAVLSYDNPEPLLRGRLNNIANVDDFKNDVIVTNFETDAILNVNGQLNANSKKRKRKCTSKNNANRKQRKLNVSQGCTSQEKDVEKKCDTCEIQPKQIANNAVREKDCLKTQENAKTPQIIHLAKDPVPKSMNHSHGNKHLGEYSNCEIQSNQVLNNMIRGSYFPRNIMNQFVPICVFPVPIQRIWLQNLRRRNQKCTQSKRNI